MEWYTFWEIMKQTSEERTTKEICLNSPEAVSAHGSKNIAALRDATHRVNLISVNMFPSQTTPPVVCYDFHITPAVWMTHSHWSSDAHAEKISANSNEVSMSVTGLAWQWSCEKENTDLSAHIISLKRSWGCTLTAYLDTLEVRNIYELIIRALTTMEFKVVCVT